MGLTRKKPLKSRPHRVTPQERAVYLQVQVRDGGCIAPIVDHTVDRCYGYLTRQHVRMQPGDPRVTAVDRVLLLCSHHHLDGWATSRAGLEKQRRYLAEHGTLS